MRIIATFDFRPALVVLAIAGADPIGQSTPTTVSESPHDRLPDLRHRAPAPAPLRHQRSGSESAHEWQQAHVLRGADVPGAVPALRATLASFSIMTGHHDLRETPGSAPASWVVVVASLGWALALRSSFHGPHTYLHGRCSGE
jgi:hypothetical protein